MDGIDRHIAAISPALNAIDGCEVAVCTVYPDGDVSAVLKAHGVKVYSLNAKTGHDWCVLTGFFRVMRDFKPDIVHCHVMAIFERVIAATFFRKTKYMGTVHGFGNASRRFSIRGCLGSIINKLFTIKSSATCFISDGVRRKFPQQKGERSYTVYNPMPFDKVNRQKGRLHTMLGLPETTPLIGTACRIVDPHKNTRGFTRVMCRVLQNNAQAHAVVMGEGEESLVNELRGIVESAGVDSRFHWLGYQKDASELIGDLSCFVLTSRWEGLPTSLLEAIAAKIPFAMMEGEGGLEDIVSFNRTEGPIGVIAPVDAEDEMAVGILKILSDHEYALQVATRAYEVGKRHFDIANVAQQLYTIYRTVCGL